MKSSENAKKNKSYMVSELETEMVDAPQNVVYSSGSTEDVRLVRENHGSFVPVYDNTEIFYGGDQNWWPDDSDKENRGCGPAAANITYYFKRKNSSRYGNLYTYSSVHQNNYLSHMDTMYDYINPGLLGEPLVLGFASDVERYATDRSVPLGRVTVSLSFTLDNTATYIKNGLNADSPVACLNRQFIGDYQYQAHWMTITKYFKDSADNRYVASSTWGERHSVNYKTWFDSTNAWGGGLIYFQ